MSKRLRVNPILCEAHGVCAGLLPELITLDPWGYPMLAKEPVPPELLPLQFDVVGLKSIDRNREILSFAFR